MTPKKPQIGARYRDVGTVFRNADWILSSLFISRDGIEHAHLTSAWDTTQRKTLALSVLADPGRFVPADI